MLESSMTQLSLKWVGMTLEKILPQHGFVFREGQKIFNQQEDEEHIIKALQVLSPEMDKHTIDLSLAGIINRAIGVRETFPTRNYYSHPCNESLFENARMRSMWAADLPNGLISTLLEAMIHARRVYIKITHYRGILAGDKGKPESCLAKAVDGWLQDKPVSKADRIYARTSPLHVQFLINKLMDREPEDMDWDHLSDGVSDYEDSDKENKDPRDYGSEDENDPWVPPRDNAKKNKITKITKVGKVTKASSHGKTRRYATKRGTLQESRRAGNLNGNKISYKPLAPINYLTRWMRV